MVVGHINQTRQRQLKVRIHKLIILHLPLIIQRHQQQILNHSIDKSATFEKASLFVEHHLQWNLQVLVDRNRQHFQDVYPDLFLLLGFSSL